MSISENIKKLRAKYNLTQDELASIAGVTNKAVSTWETGAKEPRMGAIERMSQYFGIKKSNIIEEGGLDNIDMLKSITSQSAIPLIGTICAGDGLFAEQNIEEYVYYPFPGTIQPDYALRVKGDSMIGIGVEDGDVVYMRKAQWADYNGQIVAAIINDDMDGTIKRMKWTEGSPQIQLIPENNNYETIEIMPNEVRICGVYMGHFKIERGNV